MKKNNFIVLISFFFVTYLAGFLGSFLSGPFTDYYQLLVKPDFAPPSNVFFIAWMIIYFLMSLSIYFAWKEPKNRKHAKQNVWIYMFGLILNLLWPILFFKLQNPMLGFIEIVFLWALILITIVYFYRDSKKAAILYLPYFLWVSFAMILNYALYILN